MDCESGDGDIGSVTAQLDWAAGGEAERVWDPVMAACVVAGGGIGEDLGKGEEGKE